MTVINTNTNPMPSPRSPPESLPPITTLADSPLITNINILDTLTAFYHKERMWVYRTRASLEDVEPEESPEITPTKDPHPVSTSTIITTEPAGRKRNASPVASTSSGLPLSDSSARWMKRRKTDLRLKLEDLSCAPRHDSDIEMESVGVLILGKYESMMESRMESCQRVNRLIRNANRADLGGVLTRRHTNLPSIKHSTNHQRDLLTLPPLRFP